MGLERTGARIVAGLCGATLLCGVVAAAGGLLRVRAVPKGRRAPYTMRAPCDIVWNQNELHQAAVRAFSPFYESTPGLLELRRAAILSELSQLLPAFWHFSPEEAVTDDGGSAVVPLDPTVRATDHLAQVMALGEALFDRIAPLYVDGVVADAEFPAREKEIRVFEPAGLAGEPPVELPGEGTEGQAAGPPSGAGRPTQAAPSPLRGGRYRRESVSRLHRFSELRSVADAALLHEYPTIEPAVRAQVIGYVLDRLPPNLRYSRTNADHIADRSIVTGQKAVLVRGGDVLVHRHQVVDTRAEDALRAALDASPTRRSALIATCTLVLLVTLLGGQAMAASGPMLARPGAQLVVFASFAIVLGAGRLMLALTSLSELMVPLAAVPAAVTFRAGQRAGAVVAVLTGAYASLGLAFDVSTLAVVLAGSLALALTVRRGSWRWALVGAAACGVVQTTLFGTCVAMGARAATADAVLAGVQTLVGGFVSGLLGVVSAALWQWLRAASRPARALEGGAPHATISAP
jgi:hypothetical protein